MNISLFHGSFLASLVVAAALAGCTTTQPPARQVEDLRVTAEVKSKLASEVRPSSLINIEINTTNGVVTLAGQVENAEVRQRAEAVARSVRGVADVNNNLQVELSQQGQTR